MRLRVRLITTTLNFITALLTLSIDPVCIDINVCTSVQYLLYRFVSDFFNLDDTPTAPS